MTKARMYYFEDAKTLTKWFRLLKNSSGFSNINDFYDLKEVLGEGHYGVVKVGFHKETK
jgi:hypothetical protein